MSYDKSVRIFAYVIKSFWPRGSHKIDVIASRDSYTHCTLLWLFISFLAYYPNRTLEAFCDIDLIHWMDTSVNKLTTSYVYNLYINKIYKFTSELLNSLVYVTGS